MEEQKRESPAPELQVVTVRHAPLREGDIESVYAFEDALADGQNEWAQRNGLPLDAVFRQLRETLLRRFQLKAVSVLTPEVVAKIHGTVRAAEGRALVRQVVDEISRSLEFELTVMSGIRPRGRSRQFSARDRQISRMRRKGLSYRQIGAKLGIKRNAVQAAYKRERQRCNSVCEHYAELKSHLAAIGILFAEENPIV